ncbi:MAG: GNAT family N-acetyltransferase [Actinomycetota bacterium]|nr:GNAT family N-acetyltransferase [Actinomycetota bacterium]
MELRAYRKGERSALANLGKMAFGGSVAGWEDYYTREKNPRLDPDQVYVVEEDGAVRATATVLPLETFVDGEPVAMGGVAAVNAHPAYRRRGYAGELMRAVLREMRGREVHLSMLWPFAHAFYRAYGWELCGESIGYTLKPTDLPTSPEQKHLRAYREEDLPQMMGLLEKEAIRHPLFVRRDKKQWRSERFWKDRATVVYEREGRAEGYLLYGMSDWREDRTPERTFTAHELVAESPRARAALISFMAAQDPLIFEVKYATSRGEPLHPYLRSSYVKAELEPEFMLRIVDVKGALELLDRAVDEPLVLEVSDDVVPENAGTYTLGEGQVIRGAEGGSRVTLDARQLAQLYAGYLPAEQLAHRALLECSSPAAFEALAALFPVGDPYVSPPDTF